MRTLWMLCSTGLAQGGLLWGLSRAEQGAIWPASEPVLYMALLYAVLAVPLFIYGTEQVAHLSVRARRWAVLLLGLLFAGLGAYAAWAAEGGRPSPGVGFAYGAGALVLGFVSLSLLCGLDIAARRWRYEHLFVYAWRNGILFATAAAMVGIVWGVLFAGAALMKLIGIGWVMSLIRKPGFAFPISGLAAGALFALGLARAGMTQTIRRFVLSIAAWLLPLVLFFAVLWTLALPITGLDALFETRRAASLMLAFTAMAVLFANAAYQDGAAGSPYPPWLARASQAAWLALPVLVTIAWWALGLRVAQYGWSEQRLWAALAALVASVYALGYALSWWRSKAWMQTVGKTNIAAALVLCVGLLAFLSPVADVQRLAVAAHLRHVLQHAGAQEPDWWYLRLSAGRFGRIALQAIADGQGVPAGAGWEAKARQEMARARGEDAATARKDATALREQFTVYPKGRQLPESFVEYAVGRQQSWELRSCLEQTSRCIVWAGDLNRDGQDELLLFDKSGNATVYMAKDVSWHLAGNARGPSFEPAELEDAQPIPPQWQDLQVGGRRLRLQVDR